MRGWLTLALIVLVIGLGIHLLVLAATTPRTGQVRGSDVPLLGRTLIFPDGYELVDVYAYAYGYSGPNTVYICQHIETGEYRECTPQVVDGDSDDR